MAQKPLLWVEVDAHAVRKGQSAVGWFGWARASRGACVCVVFEFS